MSKVVIKYIVILLHILIIGCAVLPALFSENLKVLGFLCFLVLIVFIQVVVYNGCILSKYERVTNNTYEFVPSELIKKILCLGDSVDLADLQKLLVGGTLAVYLVKISMILFVEVVFEMPVGKFISLNPYINKFLV